MIMASSPAKTHPLHTPRPLHMEADDSGEPLALRLSGRRLAVEAILERWRVEDEWWRERPIGRMYAMPSYASWEFVYEPGPGRRTKP